jgi:hypothetical protein
VGRRIVHSAKQERKHRRRDLTGGRVVDRHRGAFEHEQPRTGDLVRERFAVADVRAARSDGPRPYERERRERVGVVERGDLGDRRM